MDKRQQLIDMISADGKSSGASWFVAHFTPNPSGLQGKSPDEWHPAFIAFMDLRHELNADVYPCKYFEYCLADGFDFANPGWVDDWKRIVNDYSTSDQCGMKIGAGHSDCTPITYGQFVDDDGPIADANRAAWRAFVARHRLDKDNLAREADEMQPGIDYYNTHNKFIGGDVSSNGRPILEEPTPLPSWLDGLVEQEPELSPHIYWRKWREAQGKA